MLILSAFLENIHYLPASFLASNLPLQDIPLLISLHASVRLWGDRSISTHQDIQEMVQKLSLKFVESEG